MHLNTRADLLDLYWKDGVHLSDKGNGVFLVDLRQGVLLAYLVV